MPKERLQYIDAMRGTIMIMVVCTHVYAFCLGGAQAASASVPSLLRLPCFFFISGWLFGAAPGPSAVGVAPPAGTGRGWAFIRRKARALIVPSTLFLLLLAPPPEFFSRLGTTKGGYWFTFTLFTFYVIATAASRLSLSCHAAVAVALSAAAYAYEACYHRCFQGQGLAVDLLGLAGVMTWRFYLFFFAGICVRRHFRLFLTLTSRPPVLTGVLLVFVAAAVGVAGGGLWASWLRFAVAGLSGAALVFTFFRAVTPLLPSVLSAALCYVGRRTLDVYLLHYFLLPRFLATGSLQWRPASGPLPDSLAVLLIALCVVALSLAIGRIIRLSPRLSRYLLGAGV